MFSKWMSDGYIFVPVNYCDATLDWSFKRTYVNMFESCNLQVASRLAFSSLARVQLLGEQRKNFYLIDGHGLLLATVSIFHKASGQMVDSTPWAMPFIAFSCIFLPRSAGSWLPGYGPQSSGLGNVASAKSLWMPAASAHVHPVWKSTQYSTCLHRKQVVLHINSSKGCGSMGTGERGFFNTVQWCYPGSQTLLNM